MRFIIFIYIVFIISGLSAYNDRLEEVVNLKGNWKFEIGDNMKWADPLFNDENWEEIYVPSNWEDEGFPGYDGFAWYRISFDLNEEYNNRTLYLKAGRIDDADEVYLNGNLIGYSGSFPPNVETRYNINRKYFIPNEFLNKKGKNVLAIRIYDRYGEGGITNGDVGIYAIKNKFAPDLTLSGKWKFKKGDSIAWKETQFDDQSWMEIIVPSFWAAWGLKDYDGFGWYRKTFVLPEYLADERLILFLGRIDDYDVTYINGHQVGKTGEMENIGDIHHLGEYYQEYRAYYIPKEYLNKGGKNVIAVRVFDGYLHGGIYGEGAIGIITRDKYLLWRKNFKTKTNDFKSLLDYIFGTD